MNVHHVLVFCFFSALCGGNTRLVSAKVNIFTVAEGKTASINCYLSSSGSRKFFCKNKCEADDILIKTDDNTAHSGRYSINYINGSSGSLTVTFTNLTKSDSGRYRCGLGKTLFPDSYADFEVRVSDAALQDGNSGFIRTETEGENITMLCYNTVYGRHKFFCKDKCKKEEDILVETDGNRAHSGRYSIEYKERSAGRTGLYVTITQSTKSDTGRYMCGYGRALSPDSYYTASIIVIDAPTTFRPFPASASTPTTQRLSSSSGFPPSVSTEITDQFTGYFLLLVVGVPFVFVLLAVFLLFLYKWKKRRNLGLNTRGNADDVFIEASVIYENIAPVSTCEDSIYQSLDPASSDQDQTYYSLRKQTNVNV